MDRNELDKMYDAAIEANDKCLDFFDNKSELIADLRRLYNEKNEKALAAMEHGNFEFDRELYDIDKSIQKVHDDAASYVDTVRAFVSGVDEYLGEHCAGMDTPDEERKEIYRIHDLYRDKQNDVCELLDVLQAKLYRF